MRVLAISLIAAAALGLNVGCGSTDSGDDSPGDNSGNTPAQAGPVSAEEAQRWADCLEDIRSDRDSDDPRAAAADDGCLDVYEGLERSSGGTTAQTGPVSAEEARRWADCLEDIRSDRDSDDPRAAAADDGCLDVYEELRRP